MKKSQKILVLVILSMVLLIATSLLVSAYKWTCLSYNQKLPFQDWTCKSTCCKICTTDSGWSAALYRCNDKQQCACGSGGYGGELDLEPPVLTVTSPLNGENYRGYVDVVINTNEPASLYYDILEDRYSWKTLSSSRVTSYSKTIAFPEGQNTVKFKGKDQNGNEGFFDVIFTIDTKEPSIREILPKSGSYTNGIFSVKYYEKNNEDTKLHILQNGNERIIEKTDCPDGDNQICEFNANNLLDGNLEFWFTICDPVSCVDSGHNNVLVDTIKPVLTMTNNGGISEYGYYGLRSFYLGFESTEEVTLEYYDHNDARPLWKSLGKSTTFNKRLNFADGHHDVDFRAKDNAGNFDILKHEFDVDSAKPIINKETPSSRGYGHGEFNVEYTDYNIKSVALYYKPNGAEDFLAVKKTDCQSGTSETRGKASCSFIVDGLAQGSLLYYFEVEDYATKVQSRRQTEITIDTVAPELALLNMQVFGSNEYYSTRNVDGFNFEISEPVTLSYRDFADPKPREMTLCLRCTASNKKLNFADGYHDVLFTAEDNAGNSDSVRVEFNVDSVKPRITLEPRYGSYVGKDVEVEYYEKNLVYVSLYYNTDGGDEFSAIKSNDCLSGTDETRGKASCKFDISSLPEGDLFIYFEVADYASSTLSRRQIKVIHDTKDPVMTVNSPVENLYNNRYVKFNIGIDEPVLLQYIDNSALSPRWYRLSSSTTSYNSARYFSNGYHDVIIEAVDKAGNKDTYNVQFTVTG